MHYLPTQACRNSFQGRTTKRPFSSTKSGSAPLCSRICLMIRLRTVGLSWLGTPGCIKRSELPAPRPFVAALWSQYAIDHPAPKLRYLDQVQLALRCEEMFVLFLDVNLGCHRSLFPLTCFCALHRSLLVAIWTLAVCTGGPSNPGSDFVTCAPG